MISYEKKTLFGIICLLSLTLHQVCCRLSIYASTRKIESSTQCVRCFNWWKSWTFVQLGKYSTFGEDHLVMHKSSRGTWRDISTSKWSWTKPTCMDKNKWLVCQIPQGLTHIYHELKVSTLNCWEPNPCSKFFVIKNRKIRSS